MFLEQVKFSDLEERYGGIWLPSSYRRELFVEVLHDEPGTSADNNNNDVDLASGN